MDDYMSVNNGSKFFLVLGRDEDGTLEMLGDITLLNDGGAVVNNDYDGIGLRFFDSHVEALRYVETRICDVPVYYDPIVEQQVRITVID